MSSSGRESPRDLERERESRAVRHQQSFSSGSDRALIIPMYELPAIIIASLLAASVVGFFVWSYWPNSPSIDILPVACDSMANVPPSLLTDTDLGLLCLGGTLLTQTEPLHHSH
jgi:hypothetical protein